MPMATRITGVTVYPDRAKVTHAGQAQLAAAGEHMLRIGDLPLALLRESLRATGRGPAGTRILGVEQATEMHATAPEEALRRLRTEIERLEREVAMLDERIRTIEEEQQWLRTLGEQTARSLAWGIARGTAKPADAGGFFGYASEEAQRLAAAKLEVHKTRGETQRELEARRREYALLGGARRPDRIAALIRIETPAPGSVAIELSYLVPGAEWHPRYDARVDVAGSSVALTQQAIVTQRTGEDWSQVALSLSTARPAAAVRLPDEPPPHYLDVYKPMPVPVGAPKMEMALRSARVGSLAGAPGDTFAPMMAVAAAPPMEEAEMATAQMEQSGAAQIFRIPGGVDVPSDGAPHILGIGEYALPARMDYVAEPPIAEGVHLRASATNTAGRVLLPGELHVFQTGTAGDEYVGQTSLELTAQQAELPLYLGVNDNVTLKKELVERDTDRGSLLQRGIRRVTIGYRATIANRTAAPAHVVLKDRLPVPRNERIKLNVLDIRPLPSQRTKLEQLTWELELAPGEERRVEWRYAAESPTDVEVIGLP
jgi:uncharacterized protein (TIGR02231 family)